MIKQLVQTIIATLETGQVISGSVQDYIDAALPDMSSKVLKQLLESGTDSETDSLLDLIFYPGAETQERFEPLLEKAGLTRPDEKQIVDRLLSKQVKAKVVIPRDRRVAEIVVPDFVKEQFVARLHMTWQIDKDLAGVLNDRLNADNRTRLKVKFRNTGKQLSRDQNHFLMQFFQKISEEHKDFDRCTDYIASLLDQISKDTDLYAFFIDRKRSCFQSLLKAERFAKMMQRSNMETLMLQGFRAPHASKPALKLEMRLVDVICNLVFGKTEFFHRASENRIETPLSPQNDMGRIMGVLS